MHELGHAAPATQLSGKLRWRLRLLDGLMPAASLRLPKRKGEVWWIGKLISAQFAGGSEQAQTRHGDVA